GRCRWQAHSTMLGGAAHIGTAEEFIGASAAFAVFHLRGLRYPSGATVGRRLRLSIVAPLSRSSLAAAASRLNRAEGLLPLLARILISRSLISMGECFSDNCDAGV